MLILMKNIFLFGILLILAGCSTPINQEKENYEGQQILIGEVNWDGLTITPYGDWFTPNYMSYTVDEESLSIIEPMLENIEITIFLGTWCEDSQVQIPQFYKMMDHVGYDISKIKVIALERLEDARLVGPAGEEEGYDISFVPTFIFSKNGQELGRIVEYPDRTIEKDMVEIMMN